MPLNRGVLHRSVLKTQTQLNRKCYPVLPFLDFSVLPRKTLKLTKESCPLPNSPKPWKNQRKRTNNQGNSFLKIDQSKGVSHFKVPLGKCRGTRGCRSCTVACRVTVGHLASNPHLLFLAFRDVLASFQGIPWFFWVVLWFWDPPGLAQRSPERPGTRKESATSPKGCPGGGELQSPQRVRPDPGGPGTPFRTLFGLRARRARETRGGIPSLVPKDWRVRQDQEILVCFFVSFLALFF